MITESLGFVVTGLPVACPLCGSRINLNSSRILIEEFYNGVVMTCRSCEARYQFREELEEE